jgi:hypothetical protein
MSTLNTVHQHIDKIANQAGYAAMGSAGILGILADREALPENVLLALTADDVNDLYDAFVGPAVDAIEDSLA